MERSSVIKEAAEQKGWHTDGQALESEPGQTEAQRRRDGGDWETERQG